MNSLRHYVWIGCGWLALSPLAMAAAAEIAIPESTVGYPVTLEQVVLPGPELEPLPVDDETPVVIRFDDVYPHGSDFRYDMTAFALEPGTFDLGDYLQRKDGSPAEGLPKLTLTAKSLLPAGQIEPHRPAFGSFRWLGGYRLWVALGGVIWIAGFVWLFWPRRKLAAVEADAAQAQPKTLAERLRPLIVAARDGELSSAELSELERAMIALWRRRTGLQDVPPAEVTARLRQHPEAGPMLDCLEAWLHRPQGTQSDIDINALLAPYADLPPEAMESPVEQRELEGVAS